MNRLIAVLTFVLAYVATFLAASFTGLELGSVLLLVALGVASTATWFVTRRRKIARH
jgi:hypothetical protein